MKNWVRLSLGLACAFLVMGQEDGPKVSIVPRVPEHTRHVNRSNMRMDVRMVLVPVTVTDEFDRPVRNLGRKNFRIYDGGVEQKLVSLFTSDAPISVGIVFDGSGSMRSKLEVSRRAVAEFMNATLPEDEFLLVTFNDAPHYVSGFTTNPNQIEKNLSSIEPKGWTALNDAMVLAMHKMRAAKYPRKVLLVLTDGGDNNSYYTDSEIRHLVQEGDVRVFAIGILDRVNVLKQLADETGGRAYHVHNPDELSEVAAKISAEVHSQYLLGYSPEGAPRDGKYHKVEVKLVQPEGDRKLYATWRRGYYAPGD